MALLTHFVIAGLTAVAIGLLDGQGWPSYVLGAVLALSLWVMLFAGSFAGPDRGSVQPPQFAVAAVIGIALGFAIAHLGDNSSFWAVGFIMAGAVVPAVRQAAQGNA